MSCRTLGLIALLLLLAAPAAAQVPGPGYGMAVSAPAWDFRADLPGEQEERYVVIEQRCPHRLYQDSGTPMVLDIQAPAGVVVQAPSHFSMPAQDCAPTASSVFVDFIMRIRIEEDASPLMGELTLSLLPGDPGLPYTTADPVVVRIPFQVRDPAAPGESEATPSGERPDSPAVVSGAWGLPLILAGPVVLAVRRSRRKA